MKKVVSVLTIICALFINQTVNAQTMEKDVDVMKSTVLHSFTTAYSKKVEVQYTGVVELKDGNYVYQIIK